MDIKKRNIPECWKKISYLGDIQTGTTIELIQYNKENFSATPFFSCENIKCKNCIKILLLQKKMHYFCTLQKLNKKKRVFSFLLLYNFQ